METDDLELDDAEHDALEGSLLAGKYRVEHVVTVGASAILADAIDLSTDGQVSVKIVRPEYARGDEFSRKFEVLAGISAALTHPNIASVMDWGEAELAGESTVFWVVDALGGGSMRDLLDRGRLLEPGQALVVGLEACRALDAAHQKGLFHTELNPSKMVFGTDRRLRIIDFGMARLLAEPMWQDAATVPTHIARYCSPEQALGLPIDAKTDVYALALVLIEAVTGVVPFAADSTVATLAGRVDKLLPVSADLGALASVLERAGRPESADRFTAAEFGRALVQVASKLPKPEPIPIIATGTFDTTALRRPSDPTGGIERPAPVAPLAGLRETGPLAAPLVGDATVASRSTDAEVAVDDELHFLDETDDADAAGTTDDTVGRDDTAEPDAMTEADVTVEPAVGAPGDTDDPPVGAVPNGTDDTDDADDAAETDDAGDAEEAAQAVVASTEEMSLVEVAGAEVAGQPTEPLPVLDDRTPTLPDASDAESQPIYDDEARTKRRRGPILALILVLLAGLAALGYAASLLLQPKSFIVPALAGVDESAALNQIIDNDWEISTERERSDSFPDVDTVIRTEPGPGVELEEGEPFTIVLSDGPEFRELPELREMSFDSAVAILTDLELIGVAAPTGEYSEDLPLGTVISWRVLGDAGTDLRAGGEVLPGTTVEMVLSDGPVPRVVPSVVGLSVDDATAALSAVQLTVVRADDVFDEVVPAGQIVRQTPVAGELLERGTAVTVEVSKGPDVVPFPNLDGLTFAEAQTVLAESSFSVGSLLGTTEGTYVQASVNGVDIEAGTAIPRGQAVDLIFL